MPLLKRCCFCISLEKGVKIIGFVELISGLLSIINAALSDDTKTSGTSGLDGLIHVIIAILLLVGVYKSKRKLVLAFLILLGIGIVVTILGIVLSLDNTANLAQGICSILVDIYVFLVVFSYYKQGAAGETD